jgi:nitrogen fixation protein NifU and related proteins
MDLDELYQSVILDHSKRPRNYGELPPPAVKGEGYNPSCGDEITVFVICSQDTQKIERVQFVGQACAICMASTSLMTIRTTGKSIKEALHLQHCFIDFLTKDTESELPLGDLKVFGGVKKFPQRLKCATLGWHALSASFENLDYLPDL